MNKEIIEKQFNRFYKKIRLTSKQRTDAKTKYTGVCKTLHNKYYENQYNGDTKYLFGSYGKKTNIRPPRDVDVLFKMPSEEFERYDNYQTNGQSQLLQDIKDLLSETYSTTDKISGWGKVVLIQFSEGSHNVELLPAFEQPDKTFLVPNAEDGGKWESFDPRSNVEKLSNKNKITKGLLRKLIRILKKWNENTSVNIKSYVIEDWVLQYLESIDIKIEKSTSQHIRDIFSFICAIAEEKYKTPIQTATSRSEKAVEYEKDEKYEDSIDEWRKIFGADYPKNFDKETSSKRLLKIINDLRKSYPSEKEEYIDLDYGFDLRIDPQYFIKIDADVIQNGFRPNILSFLLETGGVLRKEKSLTFKIIESNIPKPYTIYWKVRNFGDEADDKGQLRGEISKDKGGEQKTEFTRYNGEHYVECYCIKDNLCIAIDNILVPIGNV